MGNIFSAKLRKIGSSVGVLIPKEQADILNIEVGDEIEVVLLKHKNTKEIEEGFGMGKHLKKTFERDKKAREFN